MKTKPTVWIMAAVFAVGTILPHAPAWANDAEPETDEVTQGELARLLVNVLGLYRFLPAAPTDQEAIAVLIANQIAPADGWDPSRAVVLSDLAQIIVKALDAAHEVADPDDPQSWIDYLAELGVPIDTVGLALTNVEPLAEPIGGNVFASAVTSDPLRKRAIFGQPDEVESGADVAIMVTQQPVTLPEIIDVIVVLPDIPPPPPFVTPD